jgi:uncharacterized protein YbbC (DUF1343 family)
MTLLRFPGLPTLASAAVLLPLSLAAQRTPVTCSADARGVVPGVEVLLRDSLHLVRGKRVGLITNHSGRDRDGRSTIDLLHKAPGVRLTALYGLEHGIRGAAKAGEKISDAVDPTTGVPVYSLYGDTRVPTPAMLKDVDVLVYDVQDVGARVYTYEWSMVLAARAARKPFIVLDRPNPIRADRVEGGMLDPQFSTLVGLYPVAARYGFTPGELLRYLGGIGMFAVDVTVVPMCGYRADMWWEDTRLPWVNPSPNLRNVSALVVYPGTVFFEGTNVSEGRGTDDPFTLIGAAWLTDAADAAAELNAMGLPGVRFESTSRAIEPGYKFGGQTIPMLKVQVTDREVVRPVALGAWMLRVLYKRHAAQWEWRVGAIDRLAGTDRLRKAVESGDEAVRTWLAEGDADAAAFAKAIAPYRLYR